MVWTMGRVLRIIKMLKKKLSELARIMPTSKKYIGDMKTFLECTPDTIHSKTLNALKDQIEYALANSPFYSSKQALFHQKLNSWEDFQKIPFTTKNDLRKMYPFGMLSVPLAETVRYGESTGTTGLPTSSFMTYDDWEQANAWVTLSLMEHFNSNDVVFISLPYELSLASHDFTQAFHNIKATVVATGSLSLVCPWSRILKMMTHLHPTALICTPSRALRLYDMLEDTGINPKSIGLKTLLYVGETCSIAKLEGIAKMWGVRILTAYGTTETNALSLPCSYGKQHLLENRFYFEVIDHKKKHVRNNNKGELIITSLCSQAMPLIRYRTNDIVSVNYDTCPCGLPFRQIQHYGRLNDIIFVNDKYVPKLTLEQTVLSTSGAGLYCAIGVINGKLHIFLNTDGADQNCIINQIKQKINKKYNVIPHIEIFDKSFFCKAMDGMLKPGSLSLEQLGIT